MVQGKKEEDSLNILIGFILIVFVALALLWAFSGITSCPEGTFSCDETISSCGCCVNDAYGNPIESCDFGICPEGYHHNEIRGCCSNTNIFDCLPEYTYCKGTLIPCGDFSCCGSDKCVEEADGTFKCVPCSVNSVCDATDVNSCCDGYACDGETGTCRRLDSCKGLTCTNYNELCMICGADSTDCLNCEDNSICVFDSKTGSGTCKTTASCLGNTCSFPGQQCSYSPTIPCPEICANVGGFLSCVNVGNCPAGTWACNLPGCPCCSIDTGDCVSCLNNPCSLEEEGQFCSYCDPTGICATCPDSICKDGLCIPKDDYTGELCLPPYSIIDGVCKSPEIEPPPEFPSCKPGYVYNEELGLCISEKPVFCNNPSCTTNLDGDYCREIVDEFNVKLCTSRCVEQTDGSFSCVIPGTSANGEENGKDYDTNDIPNWLLNLEVSCIEVCEDCQACSENKLDYDLNKDGHLNIKDYEIFMEYYNTITPPVKVTPSNEIYDFNNDGVIDEEDEKCILGVCGGDCRIIGIEDLGICVTAEYYDHSFTNEQKAAISDYDLLFNNIVNVPNTFDCSYVNSRNKPYCNSLKTHFEYSLNNMLLLRNLEYVFLERNNLGYFYSSCALMKNNKFAMYLSPNKCSNNVNVYFSKDIIYYIMGHGITAFNNCVNTLPTQTDASGNVYEGNCISFKEDVRDTCLGNFELLGEKLTNTYCESECSDLTNEEWNELGGCEAWFSNNKDVVRACLGLPSPATCNDAQKDKVAFCLAKGRCLECEQCIDIGNRVFNSCSNQNKVSSVPDLIDRFKKHNYFDVCIENSIPSSGCLLYAECFERFSEVNFCKKLAVESFWVKHGTKNSKQLFCWYDTTLYDYHMYGRFGHYSRNIIEQTILSNKYTNIEPLFSGFIDKCPDEVLCSLAPDLCVDSGGELVMGSGFYIGGDIGPKFDPIVNDPSNYAPDKGIGGFGPANAGSGVSSYIQQAMTQSGGLDTVTNTGGTTGGGFSP